MIVFNTGNRSVKRRKEWMNKYPDSSPNSLRIIDPWDPSTNQELEAAANALLSADTTDGPAILTVDKLRGRREREVYSPDDRIETNSGLYIRSSLTRDMSTEAEERDDSPVNLAKTTGDQLRNLWHRDNHICHLCDQIVDLADATRDHVIPKSLGGPNSMSNYRLAHGECNRERRNMSVDQYRAFIGRPKE